jgi:hypothetical protein
MREAAMKRATLAARHDFDMLPRCIEINVQPARHSELSALADIGNRLIPGFNGRNAGIEFGSKDMPGGGLPLGQSGLPTSPLRTAALAEP